MKSLSILLDTLFILLSPLGKQRNTGIQRGWRWTWWTWFRCEYLRKVKLVQWLKICCFLTTKYFTNTFLHPHLLFYFWPPSGYHFLSFSSHRLTVCLSIFCVSKSFSGSRSETEQLCVSCYVTRKYIAREKLGDRWLISLDKLDFDLKELCIWWFGKKHFEELLCSWLFSF